jgi:ATPase family protein associated with various cellular activities (AAA)/winged helix domain-containing protein
VRYQLSLDEFRGLFVSDEQVDALLARSGAEAPGRDAAPKREPHAGIDAVQARFRLDEPAVDVLLLALAPDLDPAYAQIYAYLNDDVRRRWPTADLARRLFGEAAEAALAADGPLFHQALLLAQTPQERLALPLAEFAANPVLSACLIGAAVACRRGLAVQPAHGQGDPGPLARLQPAIAAGETPLVAMTGARPEDCAAAVAALAGRLGRTLASLTACEDPDPAQLIRDGLVAARLTDAVMFLEADAAALSAMAPALRGARAPVFLAAPEDAAWRAALAGLPLVEIHFPTPDSEARRRLWAAAAERAGLLTEAPALAEAAERFRLSARQIETAAASLRLTLGLKPGERATASADALLASARRQAGVELGGLAQRIAPGPGWQDLVLPPASLTQLRRLGGAIRHRDRVFAEWGFSGGPGVAALFSGSPGTGKSMSASVLAREAGLDLWRIDLSAVVSKYIGETEKHLDRVFALARDGAAILFFDEADALFGKRSEVKDAHDRYANIEVAFLLQRLETLDGVVILASNLAGNVDPAFSRRMQFFIEFPLPDSALRERLWRAAIPKRAPVAGDVDLAFLAREFALTGGDIRVAALDAAFAAAADEEAIDMARLCKAVSRQLLKKGKAPSPSDFRQYQALLASAETRIAAE